MQISSIGAPLFSGALSGSNNSAANLVKKLSDKTLYLTDEKDFDDAIQKKIQLYQSDNTDSDLRKEGIDHKTGDMLWWTAAQYQGLSNMLKNAEQKVVDGSYLTYGWTETSKNVAQSSDSTQASTGTPKSEEPNIGFDTNTTTELTAESSSSLEAFSKQNFQNNLCKIITAFTMGANGYKKSLENGYLSDGAQVTDSVTALIKQSLPDGNDDWLNVTAHSLGLDQTFDSAQDFANAIENASNVVKTYADAINTVTKTLPKEDWYDWNSWGTYLDTRA